MSDPIVVLCSCGKAVPAYYYCNTCRKVEGPPNCPCGKVIAGVRVYNCPACSPENQGTGAYIKSMYYRKTGLCESGECRIPECGTCRKSDNPMTRCTVCFKDECTKCARICIRALEIKNEFSRAGKSETTVTYSGKDRKYKRGDDKERPRMFVESWAYKGDVCVQRTLFGFEKKEERA